MNLISKPNNDHSPLAVSPICEEEINSGNRNKLSHTYCGRTWSAIRGLASRILTQLHHLVQRISNVVKSIFSANSSQIGIDHTPPHTANPGGISRSVTPISIDPNDFDIPLEALEFAHGSSSSDRMSPDDSSRSGSGSRSDSPISVDTLSEMEISDPSRTPTGSDSEHDLRLDDVPMSDLPSRPLDDKRYVKVPGNGDCLFNAIAIGAKVLYADNEKIQRLLQWNIRPDAILSRPLNRDKSIHFTDSASNELLREPAAHLRNLATVYIQQVLINLQNDQDAQDLLERCNNELENANLKEDKITPEVRFASRIIKQLKEAISAYNQDIDEVKIPYDTETLKENCEKYHLEINEVLQSVEITPNAMIEKQQKMDRLHNSINSLTRSIANWRSKKISCELGGFHRSEINPLLRYLKLMGHNSFYAGYPEIEALSTLFRTPIRVVDRSNNHIELFNPQFSGPPIALDLARNHYDFILPAAVF